MEPLTRNDIQRASQLTFRVNQFNSAGVRRNEIEMQGLLQDADLNCLCVRVSDRFGDYGFVGLVEWKIEGRTFRVESFLLSCRSLGRGVEHRIVSELAAIAVEHQVDKIEIVYHPSERNMPVKQFLNEIPGQVESDGKGGLVYSAVPAELLTVQFLPSASAPEKSSIRKKRSRKPAGGEGFLFTSQPERRAEVLKIIATELRSSQDVDAAVSSFLQKEAQKRLGKAGSAVPTAGMIPPVAENEKILASIWKDVLHVESVGVKNNFFDMGGTSVHLPQILSALSRRVTHDITIIDLLQYPTISALAARMDKCCQGNISNVEALTRADKQKNAMQNRVNKRRGRF